MKRVLAVFILLTILSYFIYLGVNPPKISGKTYVYSGQDTTILGNVDIELIVKEINDPAYNYRDHEGRIFKFSSDNSGNFSYEIGYVPYISDYEFIYYKEGIGSLTYRTTLRRGRDMNFDAYLLNKSNYETSLFKGDFNHSLSYINFDAKFVIWGFILLLISIFLAVKFNVYTRLKDRFLASRQRKFSELNSEKQTEVLEAVFCKKCGTYREMTFLNEQKTHGMVFINGTCKTCHEPLKKRIK